MSNLDFYYNLKVSKSQKKLCEKIYYGKQNRNFKLNRKFSKLIKSLQSNCFKVTSKICHFCYLISKVIFNISSKMCNVFVAKHLAVLYTFGYA